MAVRVLRSDRTRRGLHVLGEDRGLELVDGNAESRELDGVEPHAHRVGASARLHLRDAVETRDRVGDLLLHEVRELHQVHLAPVGHEHVHDHAVLRRLLHRDAVLHHLRRELRLRALDGVLHVHERHVGVGAGAEHTVAVVEPLVRAVRLVVPDVVHAVDLVLHHLRDGPVKRLNAGTGVVRGDGDRDRRYVRILRNRHTSEREHSDEDEHQRRDPRRDRTPQEDARETRIARENVVRAHFAASTAIPRRTLCAPSATMCSPFSSPFSTKTNPPSSSPRAMERRSAFESAPRTQTYGPCVS